MTINKQTNKRIDRQTTVFFFYEQIDRTVKQLQIKQFINTNIKFSDDSADIFYDGALDNQPNNGNNDHIHFKLSRYCSEQQI